MLKSGILFNRLVYQGVGGSNLLHKCMCRKHVLFIKRNSKIWISSRTVVGKINQKFVPPKIYQMKLQPFGSSSQTTVLVADVDKYNGIIADIGQVSSSLPTEKFRGILTESLNVWRNEGRNSVWLKIPILLSHLISVAADQGFEFHHAHSQYSVLKLWVNDETPDLSPIYATHQVGVSGFVLREDTKQVLVVQDHHRRYTTWKFPGGLSDLGEDIGKTAEREVFEETGVVTEFQSVLTFRQQHQHPNAFGRSDIYIVCRLTPLTYDLNPCSYEIRDCKWMPLDDILNHDGIAILTKRVSKLVLYGIEEGFDKIDIKYEEFPSVYKGLRYKLYHRSFPKEWS